MEEIQRKLAYYFDEQIAACKQRSEVLAADDRKDEGNIEKVRANIYEIFKTVFSVAERVCGTDDMAKKDFFLQKAEQIPESWKTAYENAKQHGDAEKMLIESTKLDTIQEIRNTFLQVWEEAV